MTKEKKNQSASAIDDKTLHEMNYYRYGCFAYNLRRASRIVTRRYEDYLRPLGMKAFQFTALGALSQIEAMPQRTLADAFGMDASTANRNIKAMVNKGWLAFRDDPKDGRKKLICITPLGRRTFRKAIPLWEKAQAETREMMPEFNWENQLAWLFAVSGEEVDLVARGSA